MSIGIVNYFVPGSLRCEDYMDDDGDSIDRIHERTARAFGVLKEEVLMTGMATLKNWVFEDGEFKESKNNSVSGLLFKVSRKKIYELSQKSPYKEGHYLKLTLVRTMSRITSRLILAHAFFPIS